MAKCKAKINIPDWKHDTETVPIAKISQHKHKKGRSFIRIRFADTEESKEIYRIVTKG